MPKFRKKPVVVDATRWFRHGDVTCVRFFRDINRPPNAPCQHCGLPAHQHGWIDTLEGGHIVCPGDWIITGIAGEKYPCKDAIFTATYEPVEVSNPACPDL